jgi:hypothetical protein
MDLRETVIRTVCYFDLFDFPLTREEIKSLLCSNELRAADVEAAIASLVVGKSLNANDGLLSLSDRDGLEKIRAERKLFSERKWRRARRWARVFSALPGVAFAGVGNTLAYDNARDGSDIDFFIVTAPGAIWRTRFFCAALAALFDLRPKNGNNRDKLCLSFFVTTEALDMRALAIGADDVYMRYWTRQMTPLSGNQKTAELFFSKNHEAQLRKKIGSSAVWRLLCAPLGLLPGAFMRGWQQRHFPKAIVDAAARRDGSVVISDAILKFHVSDRRADIYERWQKRVESILHESRETPRTN